VKITRQGRAGKCRIRTLSTLLLINDDEAGHRTLANIAPITFSSCEICFLTISSQLRTSIIMAKKFGKKNKLELDEQFDAFLKEVSFVTKAICSQAIPSIFSCSLCLVKIHP
jgi:hypothetical protein